MQSYSVCAVLTFHSFQKASEQNYQFVIGKATNLRGQVQIICMFTPMYHSKYIN